MDLRALHTEDYQGVDRLMEQLHQLHKKGKPDYFTGTQHPYSREDFDVLVASDQVIALAAVEDETIVGLCIVTLQEKSGMVPMRMAYMDDLAVDPAYQHRGIATALFREAERQAKALGARRLDLTVWAFNEPAHQLYTTLGMRPQRYILEKNL